MDAAHQAVDHADAPDVAVREPTVGVGLQDPQLDEATQLLDARAGSLGCDRDLVPFHGRTVAAGHRARPLTAAI